MNNLDTTNIVNLTTNDSYTLRVDALELFQALDAGKHAISKDVSMDALFCMLFEYKEGSLFLSALDGHAFFHTKLPVIYSSVDTETKLDSFHFMLVKKDVETLQGLLKSKKGYVDINVSRKAVIVKRDYEVSFEPKGYANFPDYKPFFRKTEDYEESTALTGHGFSSSMFTQLGKLTKYTKFIRMYVSSTEALNPMLFAGRIKSYDKDAVNIPLDIIMMPLKNVGI